MSDPKPRIEANKKAVDRCVNILTATVLAKELFHDREQAEEVVNKWKEKRNCSARVQKASKL